MLELFLEIWVDHLMFWFSTEMLLSPVLCVVFACLPAPVMLTAGVSLICHVVFVCLPAPVILTAGVSLICHVWYLFAYLPWWYLLLESVWSATCGICLPTCPCDTYCWNQSDLPCVVSVCLPAPVILTAGVSLICHVWYLFAYLPLWYLLLESVWSAMCGICLPTCPVWYLLLESVWSAMCDICLPTCPCDTYCWSQFDLPCVVFVCLPAPVILTAGVSLICHVWYLFAHLPLWYLLLGSVWSAMRGICLPTCPCDTHWWSHSDLPCVVSVCLPAPVILTAGVSLICHVWYLFAYLLLWYLLLESVWSAMWGICLPTCPCDTYCWSQSDLPCVVFVCLPAPVILTAGVSLICHVWYLFAYLPLWYLLLESVWSAIWGICLPTCPCDTYCWSQSDLPCVVFVCLPAPVILTAGVSLICHMRYLFAYLPLWYLLLVSVWSASSRAANHAATDSFMCTIHGTRVINDHKICSHVWRIMTTNNFFHLPDCSLCFILLGMLCYWPWHSYLCCAELFRNKYTYIDTFIISQHWYTYCRLLKSLMTCLSYTVDSTTADGLLMQGLHHLRRWPWFTESFCFSTQRVKTCIHRSTILEWIILRVQSYMILE